MFSSEQSSPARPQLKRLPTQNTKFEKMLDNVFQSKMSAADVKDHITKYVQVLETNYTEVIRDLKDAVKQQKANARNAQASVTNSAIERSDLESLFLDCVEKTRQQIMAQRLKQEFLMQ